jgi:multisubunit Na+/H+ antiporter MnhE subunit
MFLGIKNPKTFVLGFIFGMCISVLGFKLLDNTIQRAITMQPAKANGYATAHYFLRYLIYFIVLVIAALADYLSFSATVLGLFMVKIVIIASTVYDSIKVKKK